MKGAKMDESKVERQIYLDQEWKIEHWMDYFQVSREMLMKAVEEKGRGLKALEIYFDIPDTSDAGTSEAA